MDKVVRTKNQIEDTLSQINSVCEFLEYAVENNLEIDIVQYTSLKNKLQKELHDYILSNVESVPPEFAQILDEHFWELI